MKFAAKLALAGVSVFALSGVAMAADLARPVAAPVAASTNWDGLYIGANVGYGWGTATPPSPIAAASTTGFLIDGHVGYNTHLSDSIVGGIEGDIGWSNEAGTIAGGGSPTFNIGWEGSVRGRLGYDVDGLLPYVEAGVAFANASISSFSTSNTYTGWTVGVGAEYALSSQVSANLELRYTDYGSQTYSGNAVRLTDTTVRAGINYHF